VVFQNDTEVDFWLLFTEQEMCGAGQTTPVPLDLCRAMVSVLPRVPEAVSWLPVDLHELNSPAEISAGDAYFQLIPKSDESGLKTVIHISAPIIIRSAVPLPMKIQLESKNNSVSHLLSKGELCKVHAFSNYDDVNLVLSFQNYMTSKPTLITSRRQESARSIKLLDKTGEDLDLYLDYRKEGNLMVTVYPAMVIINSTALPLTFYYKKTGTVRRIPGQLNPAIVLSDTCRKLCLGLDRCRSRPFKTGAAGAINIITVDTEEDTLGDSIRYQFVYNVEVAWLFPMEVIYTRVVTVTPRFIIVNGLTEELLVRQAETNECCLSVRPGDQSPFYWPNGGLQELVQVTIGQGRYSWSGALVISNIGVTAFCCLPLEPALPLLHLRAEVKFTDLSVLVCIEEETDKYCSYRLENLSTRISFCVYQESNPEAFQWLDACSSIVFSWKEPALPHKIVAEMFLGQLTGLPVKSGSAYWFSPDNINDMSKIKIELTDELGQYITARTLNIGTCKVLRFYDSVLRVDDTKEAERAATQITVTVPRLGISLVEKDTRTSEVVYVSFSRLELRATRSAISQQVELIVDRVQIDNQHSLRACFPVLLAPKDNTGHGKPTISCKFDYHVDQSPNYFHVQLAEMEVQPLIVQVESLLMVRLMALWQRIVPSFSESEAFQNISTRSGLRSQAILKGLMIPQAEKSFYLRQLRLHAIQISLSFLPVKDMDDRDNDTFTAFIHAVGMVVSTIDSAPIEFEAVEKNDLVGMQKQITSALWLSYQSQLASQLLSLIGHANVLGNPVGLLDGLGRGVADFFSAPAQGMRSGPLDAGIGLIKGAESLLKNTVSATFGSVSKLAGTMATGLSALTQDKYFLSERQRESVTARPSNVVEGVEMGVKSLFRSFGKGLAGVVTEPLKGAKRDGFTGLLSGSLKGIGGLVAQPMAGMFDMTSRTAEGIMNTAVDNVANLQRVRDPRVIYGLSCKLLPYRAEDAAVRLYVAQLKKGKYMRDHYVCHMQVQDRKNVKCFIVLSVEHLLLVLMHSRKVIYEIKCEDMLAQRLVDKGLEVRTLPSSFKKTKGTQVFTFPIHSREMLERLHKKLQKLIRPRDFAVAF
jgi:vacuolar protein sorting-associated protein 13A/C